MLANIMQGVDNTILNVALPHIQGSLSASLDQIAWALTSYIVCAAIMMPLNGWLPSRLGRVAFRLDLAIEAVTDCERENPRRPSKEASDRFAPVKPAQAGAFPQRVLCEQHRNPVDMILGVTQGGIAYGDSMTYRSLRPSPCSTRMVIRVLSMASILSEMISKARNPAP